MLSETRPTSASFPIRPYNSATSETSVHRAAVAIAYTKSWSRDVLHWILAVLSGGVYLLLVFWFPMLGHVMKFSKTTDILKSSRFVIVTETGKRAIVSCRKITVSLTEMKLAIAGLATADLAAHQHNVDIETVVFEYRCLQFLFNVCTNEFEHLSFNVDAYLSEVGSRYSRGVESSLTLEQRQRLYGPSCVEIPMQPLVIMIIAEIFHPIYVFQMLAICLWLWDQYYEYAGAIIVITVVSLCTEIYETRANQIKLQELVNVDCQVSTLRWNGNLISPSMSLRDKTPVMESQRSRELVPGDVLELYCGMTLACDVLLLEGSVVVSECVLTGESMPIVKRPVSSHRLIDGITKFNVYQDSTHILFGGTQIIGICRQPNAAKFASMESEPTKLPTELGLVICTGFSTTQGQLMRSILFPYSVRRSDFVQDTYKFLAVLAGLAFFCAFFALVITYSKGLHLNVILIRFLDTFTTAIPPALPATMTVGSSIAVTKLKRLWDIVTVAPTRVNYAGQVNTMVLDKTGTITGEFVLDQIVGPFSVLIEEGLSLKGILAAVPLGNLDSSVDVEDNLDNSDYNSPNDDRPVLNSLSSRPEDLSYSVISALSSCHSLSLVDDVLAGDPMEVQLLKFSESTVVDVSVYERPRGMFDWELPKVFAALNTYLPCLTHVLHSPKKRIPNKHLSTSKRGVSDGERYSQLSSSYNLLSLTDMGRPSLTRIVKNFSLTSGLHRMSVVAWDMQRLRLNVYCKGSPEQVCQLSKPSSIPINFDSQLRRYTETGNRVLAIASKEIPLDDGWRTAALEGERSICQRLDMYSRSEIESDLIFNGLIVFANILKPDSHEALALLEESGCRCIMATGDNPFTAASVARDVDLIRSTAESIVVGEIVQVPTQGDQSNVEGMSPKILWTPISYSSLTFAGLNACTDVSNACLNHSAAATNIRVTETLADRLIFRANRAKSDYYTLKSKRKILETAKTTIEHSESLINQRQVTVCFRGRPDEVRDETPIEDLRHYLAGKDPREVVLVLTGPVFRLLKEYHETMKFEWCDSAGRVIGVPIELNGRQSPCAMGKPQSANAPRFKDDVLVDEATVHPNGIRELMTLQISVNEKSNTEVKVSSAEGKCNNNLKLLEMSLFEYCLRFCRVFARMVADDKSLLIQQLQSLPSHPLVGMCGDGANDIGVSIILAESFGSTHFRFFLIHGIKALRVADVGLALSDKEASIAAPFTSTNKTLLSTVDLLREGRGALVNSFQSFKFITVFALIQIITVSILHWYGGNLADPQYLWTDLVLVLPLAMTMAWTNVSPSLSSRMPCRKLISLPTILSIVGQVLIQLLFITFGLLLVSSMHFYQEFQPNPDVERFEPEDLAGYENTVVFLVSNFQYMTINITFLTVTDPFTNVAYTACFICLGVTSFLFLVVPYETVGPLARWLAIMETPFFFRVMLGGLILLNVSATVGFEHLVVVGWAFKNSEIKELPSHFIDMVFPLDMQQEVRFIKPIT